ncbi:hypothetical protein GSI_15373 [Ganoderma sinense ZZ0214-1]|uniref:Uncharacterized protein n=1 Tax=Ganoderma sinense ZZ0214-1 TaxID=1077348 RepID=A0A2G8RME9_9APHY|nr:hypothetical protein GSI_15373 [Ganoderma sinense ZZ0214-1]
MARLVELSGCTSRASCEGVTTVTPSVSADARCWEVGRRGGSRRRFETDAKLAVIRSSDRTQWFGDWWRALLRAGADAMRPGAQQGGEEEAVDCHCERSALS